LANWWTICWTIYRIGHEVMVGWGVSRLVSMVFFYKGFLPFLSRERKGSQKKPPASRFILRVVQPDEKAAPFAALRRCQACPGAHNLTIAARFAPPMLSAGQRKIRKPKAKNPI
jgi:hypothetical protein